MKIQGALHHKIIAIIILLMWVMTFNSCSCARNKLQKPSAVEGILDLSEWDFSSNGILPLDGEWEIYWNKLLDSDELNQVEIEGIKEYVHVPDFWNKKMLGGEEVNGFGFATLRLKVKTGKEKDLLVMRIMRIYTAYNIWINGELVDSEGKVGDTNNTALPSFDLKEITIPVDSEGIEILIQISNFHHSKGGIRNSLFLGKPDQIRRYGKIKFSYDLFLVSIVLIMTLYIFWLYRSHPSDKSPLYFGLVCLFTATHLLGEGEMLIVFYLSEIRWETLMKIDFISNYLRAAFLAVFLRTVFPKEISRYFSIGMLIWASLFSILILITQAAFYSKTLVLFEVVVAMAMAYVIFGLIMALVRGRRGAVFSAIGIFALLATAVNDILYNEMIINSVLLFPAGLFICIYFHSFLLAARFTKLYKSVNSLSRRLLSLDKIKNAFIANTSKYNLEIPFKAILENTKADKGFIYIREKEKWILKVFMSLDEKENLEPLANVVDFSASSVGDPVIPNNLINMAIEEERNILLDNALEDDRIRNDLYIQKFMVKSALCMRIVSHENLIGLLYLENQKIKGAFNEEILGILELLSPQLTTLLDNIEIFGQLESLNRNLEQNVKERTIELTRQKHVAEVALKNLVKTQSQLVQSERMASLGQLTAGIAHELNNPINFISGNVNPLKRDITDILALVEKYEAVISEKDLVNQFGEVENFRKEMDLEFLVREVTILLEGIGEGAFRSSEIIKGLRSFSRLDDDMFIIANLHEGVDSILVLLQNRTKDRITVHRNYAEISEIECRPTKLNQVFMNILTNAIDSIEERGDIFIDTSMSNSNIIIKIRDTGKGMGKKISDHVFEPFYTTKDVGEGMGLGLSVSYGIIDQHKGKIDVQSEPGKGSEFIITLPIRQD
jgi:signal transduction histidine kinase